MPRSSKTPRYDDYVEHPRYGRSPRFTDANPDTNKDFTIYLHWHSPADKRVPDTAVEANPKRQAPATVHVTHYFDVRRTCEDCKRPFLFFAEEQKFWYEELGFPLESDAVRCAPCRKNARGIARVRGRYEALYHAERSREEELEFVECLRALVAADAVGPRAAERLRALEKRLPPGSGRASRQGTS